ncbi:unnamed protein product [Danaus chrysippus]|uniref:(African queen) hypothetical protein n=1 Tax=Danaus chrysippus TaxID=151541 RepID=A0A8J2QW80_9NEOP|nr:unnamed protein product [Danaus chrysippus]
MPKSYEPIITALETVEELKLDFVKNRLLGEEEQRNRGETKSKLSLQSSCVMDVDAPDTKNSIVGALNSHDTRLETSRPRT